MDHKSYNRKLSSRKRYSSSVFIFQGRNHIRLFSQGQLQESVPTLMTLVLESTFNAWRLKVGYFLEFGLQENILCLICFKCLESPGFDLMSHQKNVTWKKQNEHWLLRGKVFIAYPIPNTFARKFCTLKVKFIACYTNTLLQKVCIIGKTIWF